MGENVPDGRKHRKASRRRNGTNGRKERADKCGHRLVRESPAHRIGVAIVAEAEVQRKPRAYFPVILDVRSDHDFPEISGRVVQGWNRWNRERQERCSAQPKLATIDRRRDGVRKEEATVGVCRLEILGLYSGDYHADLQAMGTMRPGNVIAAAELILNDLIGPIRVRADREDDRLKAAILAVLARQFAGLGSTKCRGSLVIAGPPSEELNAVALEIWAAVRAAWAVEFSLFRT